jgi:hypothetical protein
VLRDPPADAETAAPQAMPIAVGAKA